MLPEHVRELQHSVTTAGTTLKGEAIEKKSLSLNCKN